MEVERPGDYKPFPAYLQGMETQFQGNADKHVPVPSLPTRNGNPSSYSPPNTTPSVPSLPTRNGNEEGSLAGHHSGERSQPTYKEWKLVIDDVRYQNELHVPSLPTRNGNH